MGFVLQDEEQEVMVRHLLLTGEGEPLGNPVFSPPMTPGPRSGAPGLAPTSFRGNIPE
jgi:hypothetical protein